VECGITGSHGGRKIPVCNRFIDYCVLSWLFTIHLEVLGIGLY
jgi:hypothetical protein